MLAKLKALSTKQKVLIGALAVLVVYGMSHQDHSLASRNKLAKYQPTADNRADYSDANYPGTEEDQPHRPTGMRDLAETSDESQMASQQLQQFQNEHTQIGQQAQACMAQMNQAAGQMAAAAMNGQMPGQAPCAQYMAQWAARLAFLETEIYRLQTGDRRSSLQQITGTHGYQPGSGSSNQPSYYRPSTPDNDGGIAAVERADRQGIRGTSMYAEEDGTQHELTTAPYYFKNRETGAMVPSNSGVAPNDGSDNEPVTAQE